MSSSPRRRRVPLSLRRQLLALTLIASIIYTIIPLPRFAFMPDIQTVGAVSANIVISQVYGGGGSTSTSPTPSYKNDFIELFNRGNSSVNVSAWSVQYAAATSGNWTVTPLCATGQTCTIGAGKYFLVQEGTVANATGATLPSADATGTIGLSGSTGKVALVTNTTQLGTTASPVTCPSSANYVDLVGYGSTTTTTGFCYEGSGPTPALSITTAALRASNGCTDTDNNASDFATGAPNPRNSGTAANSCTPTNPSGTGSANPSTVAAGGSTVLTVTVTPGTNPTSTGITVTTDLSSIGGSSTQQFFDDGTHGDVTANDKTFSFQATVSSGTSTGSKSLLATITDGQGRTSTTSIALTVTAAPTPPTGTGSASPASVVAGQSTLLTVAASPGGNPPSTFITVTGDLSSIGIGSSTQQQQFFDDGTHGDATANNGVFSFLATVTSNTTPGAKSLPITINDAQGRTSTTSISLTVLPAPIFIHDVQGSTDTPNFVGTTVTVQGIVIGDFQGSSGLSGFFVEEEQADQDNDPATSEGIFVFDGSAPAVDVNVGDLVTVTGTVANTFGLTQLSSPTVRVNTTDNALPTAASISLPVSTSPAADLERYEGMRVAFSQTLFVTDNLNLGKFGELTVSGNSRLYIPTNSIDPNDNPASGTNTVTTASNTNVAAVTAQETANNNDRIILDDASSRTNNSTTLPLNPIPYLGPSGTPGTTVRIGDTINNATGILSYDFGSYLLEPTTPITITPTNPRPAAPDSVGITNLRVGSFNVENYFLTYNGTSADRGANNDTEHTRQRNKIIAALKGLDADIIGLYELQKAPGPNGVEAAADLASGLSAATGQTYAAVANPATKGTDPDIKSGIIYRTSTVTAVDSSFTDMAAPAGAYSRDPLAQTFTLNSNGEKFTVVANHLKAKACSSSSAPEDRDQGDGQGCYNDRRRKQAQYLTTFINTIATTGNSPRVITIGDFNAHTEEDPIDTLRAAGLIDIIGQYVPLASRYSFSFSGEEGQLDHAFGTSAASAQVTGATIWHINTDEPDILGYDTNDAPDGKPDDRYQPNAYRSSDHDPLLIGLNLAATSSASTPDLQDASDTGASNTDNLTNDNTPTFDIAGVTNGATVELLRNGVVVATGTASGATISLTDATVPADGTYSYTSRQTTTGGGTSAASSGLSVTIDTTAPTVTINQAAGQADPTNTSPINFTVVFSKPVTGFDAADVSLSGTAGATTATVTGSGTTYNVAVSGMTSSGTVTPSVRANAAADSFGNASAASTSTDNTVTYNAPMSPVFTNGAPPNGTVGTAYTFTFTASGTPSPTFSVTSGTPPAGLNLAANGTLSGTPTTAGSFTFTVTASNGVAPNATQTVTIKITGAPVANNDTFTVNENSTLNVAAPGVLANDTDAAGNSSTAVKVSDPSHGSVTLNSNGSFTYTPVAGFSGADTFTYKANNGTFDSNNATVTINVASGGSIQFSVAAYNVRESDGTATITVTRTGGSSGAASVSYATSNGTATAGSDYTGTNGTISFADGEQGSKTFTVPIINDTINESSETVTLTLSNVTGSATLGSPSTATLMILDDDSAPTLAIGDVTQTEGNTGATAFTFTVMLAGSTAQTVTVNYATSDGTATAGSDYTATSGTLTFNPGETSKQITVQATGDTQNEPDETFFVNLTNAVNATLSRAQGTGTIRNDDAVFVQFNQAAYTVSENDGAVIITVTRAGDASAAASIDYSTSDVTAKQKSDYTIAIGTLFFAAGETTKTFPLIVNPDSFIEGAETLTITLSNPVNASLGAQTTAVVTITDSTTDATRNSIDDARTFVYQQYHDFLNREPDAAGIAYWTNEITKCGNDAACITRRRTEVSAAFFVEKEFQDTGFAAYRLYKAMFGRAPTYLEYTKARSQFVAGQSLTMSKQRLAEELMNNADIKALYDSKTDAEYVDATFANTSVVPPSAEREELISSLENGALTRAGALVKVADTQEFVDREYNAAFVTMQYFGYLRRDADEGGFQFWLDILNNRQPNNYRGMVCAFVNSREYQERFSTVVTRTDRDCAAAFK